MHSQEEGCSKSCSSKYMYIILISVLCTCRFVKDIKDCHRKGAYTSPVCVEISARVHAGSN